MRLKIQHTLSVFLIFLLTVSLNSCVNISNKKGDAQSFDSVKILNIFECDFDIRSINVNHKQVFFSGSKGHFGYLNTADNSVAYVGTIKDRDSLIEFRASAKTGKINLILSAGNPALVYKVNYFGKRKLLYHSDKSGVFYDAMAFWNNQEGLIIGDPIEGCMAFLITRNGGRNWHSVNCDLLPEAEKGEAAFAASNSNIAIQGDKAWVISGGKTSRVYFTKDKGKKWQTFDTPLINGKNTTGGYSIDFYNSKIGFIIGGDYTNPKNNRANKALTIDGGKTWRLMADNQDPGYMSCVKFVPGSGGKEIIAVGKSGIYYSKNQGENWEQLSTDGFYTLEFLNDFTAYAAGQNKIAKLIFLEKDFNQD